MPLLSKSLLLSFTGTLTAAMFAQLEGVPAGAALGWLSVLLQGGSFGVLVYLVVKGLPAERQKERDDFAAALKGERELFEREQKETRQLLYDALGNFRSAVHDVKDAAQAAVTKAAVAVEVSKAVTGIHRGEDRA